MVLVIPLFIPHEGCPHDCVFCNQRRISGFREAPVRPADVRRTIETWLEREQRGNRPVQAAFYGGSFTGLARQRQQELLAAAAPFVEQGRVQAIRLSTRPDYIDADKVDFLRARSVSIVELGVQSMDDNVLARSGRGHTAADVEHAVAVLRDGGMEIGLQLMIGLPGETRRIMMDTVQRIIELQPDFVRIYPVLVVQNSALADQYSRGTYQPLSLDKAVIMAAWMKKKFDRAHIRVVRMGLQAGPDLEESLVAGPWHPAFGELVNSRIMLQQTRKLLAAVMPGSRRKISISPKDQSIFQGMNRKNRLRLDELNLTDRFTLTTDPDQQRNTIRLIPET